MWCTIKTMLRTYDLNHFLKGFIITNCLSVSPLQDTRIELTPMHENKTGYINASFIQVPIARELFQYVAAQAPLEDTVIDWWRMVWEKDIHVIAMLTKLEVRAVLST